MLANFGSVLAAAVGIAASLKQLYDLGKDVSPQWADLKRLTSGEDITEDELAEIRSRSDAVNADIEAIEDRAPGT